MFTLYAGLDESGNGKSLEVHSLVSSLAEEDSRVFPENKIMPKVRLHDNLFNRLSGKSYSFLLFRDRDKIKVKKAEKLGVITTSLLEGEFNWAEIRKLKLYLDGARSTREIRILESILTGTLRNLDPFALEINYGPKFDQKYPVVNMADQLANFLYKQDESYLAEDSHRKPLLY